MVIFGGTINLVVTALTAEKSGAIFDPAIPALLLIFAFVITWSATFAVFIPAPKINPKKSRPLAGAVVNVIVLAAIV